VLLLTDSDRNCWRESILVQTVGRFRSGTLGSVLLLTWKEYPIGFRVASPGFDMVFERAIGLFCFGFSGIVNLDWI